MTTLTYSIANTHDHWDEQPAVVHAGAALQLFWRHVERRHPFLAAAIEWCGAGAFAVTLLLAQLVANA